MPKHIIIFLLTAIIISNSGCTTQSKSKKHVYQEFEMDTMFQITVFSDKAKFIIDRTVQQGFKIITRLKKRYGATDENSLVYKLNNDKTITADTETKRIFKQAYNYAKQTGGAFEPTILPIMKLWGFPTRKYRVPTSDEINQTLTRVGYANIIIGDTISLSNNAGFDPGGILKGYAVDRVVEFFKLKGIKSGIVNAGGNLRVFGTKPNAKPWGIGIRHPRDATNIIDAVYTKQEIAIATSGDYERFFIVEGQRYHHIMSPKTGKPIQNGVVSVSVLADNAEATDALSTALFVMGLQDGLAYANKHKIPAMFVMEIDGNLEKRYSDFWVGKK